MINTKPTANHIANIKKYKKFLENWDMWDFAFYNGEEYYFLTQYLHLNKFIKGYLILNSKGEVLPLEKAKEYGYYLINYNTILSQTVTEMGPRIYNDMSPFKELMELLKKNKDKMVSLSPEISDSVERVIEENNKNIEQPLMIKEIVYTIGGYQREVTRERGYFDQEFLEVIRNEVGNYSELMYGYGITQRELLSDYQKIINLMNNKELNINTWTKAKIKNNLKNLIESNSKALERSLKTFEYDDEGNKLEIDLNHMKESLLRNSNAIGRKNYESKIATLIRNP